MYGRPAMAVQLLLHLTHAACAAVVGCLSTFQLLLLSLHGTQHTHNRHVLQLTAVGIHSYPAHSLEPDHSPNKQALKLLR